MTSSYAEPPPEVVWTSEARDKLRPRPPAPERLDATALRARVSRALPRWDAAAGVARLPSYVHGQLRPADEPTRKLLVAALEAHAAEAAPPSLDPAVEGLLLVSLGDEAAQRSLLHLWAARGGPEAMMRAFAEALHVVAEDKDYVEVVLSRADQPVLSWRSRWLFQRLREALASMPEDLRVDACRAAVALSEPWGEGLRAALAYACDDRRWIAESARALSLQVRTGTRLAAPAWLLLAATDDAAAAREFCEAAAAGRSLPTLSPSEYAYEMVERLGVEAAPALGALLGASAARLAVDPNIVSAVHALAEALVLVRSPEAAAALAPVCDQKALRPLLSAYFGAAPHLAVRALAPVASGRHATASAEATDAAATLLAGPIIDHPALCDALLPSLHADGKAGVERVRRELGIGALEAAPEELPEILRAPPWTLPRQSRARSKKAASSKPITSLQAPAREERIAWEPGQREAWQRAIPWSGADPMEWVRRAEGELDAGRRPMLPGTLLLAIPEQEAVRIWSEYPPSLFYWDRGDLQALVARFELAATWLLLRLVEELPSSASWALEAMRPLDSTRLATPVARALRHRKRDRAACEGWLLAHAETAALALLPAALGPAGSGKEEAAHALRFLGARGHAEAVRAAASVHGTEASGALEMVLADDPRARAPAKPPKMPAFWRPERVPRPRLRDGRALPVAAVDHLGAMLAFTDHEEPFAGLERVREDCDPASLERFAWGLFHAWLLSGGSAKDQWAFFALGHLGSDATAHRLAPMIRAWPTEGNFGRAVIGLGVLATLGTDAALMHIWRISQKVKSKPLLEKAKERIAQIAAVRGLSSEELADRLVPDLGLDPDGSTSIDLGGRLFRVGFDEHLHPYVVDPTGKRMADLPRPAKTDVGDEAKASYERWKALKKEAKEVAGSQILRLENAMSSRHRWAQDAFRSTLVDHPLLVHLVRRIVWGAYAGSGRLAQTFRVAEDRTLASIEDAPIDLATDRMVGIPHPLELAEVSAAWGQVLADYQLIQPFPQLGREVHHALPEEGDATEASRFRGRHVPTGRVFSLEDRGWRRQMAGGGTVGGYEKSVGGARLELSITPGIYLGEIGMHPEQELGPIALSRRIRDLDPIVFSEAVRDLAHVTAR